MSGTASGLEPSTLQAPNDRSAAAVAATAAGAPARDFVVVICTRDRPELVMQTLDALADQDDASFDVLVVDQSTQINDALLARAAADPRLEVVLDTGRSGLSRSRNLAWRAVDHTWLAFLDDDARPAQDWTRELRRVLGRGGQVDFVSGHVEPSDEPSTDDYIAVSAAPQLVEAEVRGRWTRPWRLGLGIGMVVRRQAVVQLNGWDERLGAGAPRFRAAEDMDFNYRLLRAGGSGLLTPRLRLSHVQWRGVDDLADHYAGYMLGWTAFAMKQIKTGDPVGGTWLWLLGALDAARMTASALRRRSPLRARVARAKLRALVVGTWEGGRANW